MPPRRRPTPRFLGVSVGVLVLLAGGVWWIILVQWRGRDAEQHLLSARATLDQGLQFALSNEAVATQPEFAAVAAGQVASACADTVQADSLLRDLEGQLQPIMPLVDLLGSVPGVGERARGQAASLDMGTQLAAAGTAVCEGVRPFTGVVSGDQSVPNAPTLDGGPLGASLAARPKLVEAADKLEKVMATLNKVAASDVDESTRASLGTLRLRLPATVQTLRDAVVVLDMLGASGDRHYLLVSQNPDELRPTGGYIGSAGVVAVGGGSVRLIEYGSSRAYDTPADQRAITPPAFSRYLGDYWGLAGANWWASFPDVARQLAYFYGVARPGQTIDGVIALDQFGLQKLLTVLGPVDVPEYGERVGAADVQAALDRHVHAPPGEDEAGRKQFTAALSTAVLRQVLAAPRSLIPAMLGAVHAAVDQQHLLFSVWDAKGADLLARRHWDGGLFPVAGDGLLIVDSDVVGSKQSQEIRRDVAYSVDLTNPGAPRGEVSITYTNSSRPELRPDVHFVPDYRTFVQVYAAPGATLTRAQGFVRDMNVDQECGRSVFGGEVLIPQGTTITVVVDYKLPSTVFRDGDYEVLVQQQPGVPPGSLSVAIATPNGGTARTEQDNLPGRNFDWRLDDQNGRLVDRPLPPALPGGCERPVVASAPIAEPAWLDIPAANVSSSIVDLGLDADGAMEAPPTPDVVGWYRMSARAGQPGNSVFSGHVDWRQDTAVFWGLRNLVPGDPIIVRGSDGVQHRYRVEWNRVFDRDDAAANNLVQGSDDSLMTLITCAGVYDRSVRDYSGRRIVRATLVD